MTSDQIFISYGHDDETWKNRLVRQLRVLEYEELLSVWEDRQIAAGDDWLPEIEAAIQSCGMALLLISAQFLTSKFIRGKEVPALLQRLQQGGVRIIPVILKSCAWTRVSWLTLIQARPKDGKPLSGMSEHDAEAALAVLAEEVADLLAGGVLAPIFVSNSHRKPALPAIENIHGWLLERVQALQQQTAQALGLSAEFSDDLVSSSTAPPTFVLLGTSVPVSVQPGEEFTVRFIAYLQEFESQLDKILKGLSPRSKSYLWIGRCLWQEGLKVTVILSCQYLDIDEPQQEFEWHSPYQIIPFDVVVQRTAPRVTVVLNLDVNILDIRVATLRLDLRIDKM